MRLLLIQPLMYLLPRVVFRFFLMLLIKLHILIYMSVQKRKMLKKKYIYAWFILRKFSTPWYLPRFARWDSKLLSNWVYPVRCCFCYLTGMYSTCSRPKIPQKMRSQTANEGAESIFFIWKFEHSNVLSSGLSFRDEGRVVSLSNNYVVSCLGLRICILIPEIPKRPKIPHQVISDKAQVFQQFSGISGPRRYSRSKNNRGLYRINQYRPRTDVKSKG